MLSALNDGDARSKTLLARLAEQPKSPAIIGVAEVLCKQGRYSEAITRLRSVAEFYGDIYRFNLVLARACRDAGKTELAKEHYEKACQIAPQNEVAIKELITLTAFPHTLPTPSSLSNKHAMDSETAPALAPQKTEPLAPEPETPSTFKLNREKLSKVLGGMVGSIEKRDATPTEVQNTPSSQSNDASAVVEAFRKTDNLLEQEPDIDALAREMMGGNAFLPQEPSNTSNTSKNDVTNTPDEVSSESAPPQQPKIVAPRQPSTENETDIDAIARQMLGIGYSDELMKSTSTRDSSVVEPTPLTPTPTSTPSAPTPIPLDENGNPIINIDRDKLAKALSGIHKAKGIAPSTTQSDKSEDDMPFSMPTKASPESTPTPPAAPPQSSSQDSGALSFEEEIMAMQMQGSNIDVFISNKDTAHRNQQIDSKPTTPPLPLSNEDDIDALAREIMNAQLPKVEETNDPTPIAEQRQPFSDDDIKTPTRQLAKIFQSQGAYAKAIKVYEMLSEREPENASLYDILISELRNKMNAR
jgi:tetratricopeptide (TPR) repeat protein